MARLTTMRTAALERGGAILPLVIVIVFLCAILDYRIARRTDQFTAVTVARVDRVKAAVLAHNMTRLRINGLATAAPSAVRRLSAEPIRIDLISDLAAFGQAASKSSYFKLSSGQGGSLPDWELFRKFAVEQQCAESRLQLISTRTCSADRIEEGRLFIGNLTAKPVLAVQSGKTPLLAAAIGDIDIGELRLYPQEGSIVVLAAIGTIRIKKFTLSGKSAGDALAIFLHSSRGSIEIDDGAGLDLCSGDVASAGRIKAALRFNRFAAIGGKRLGGQGRAGCDVEPPDAWFVTSKAFWRGLEE